MKAIVIGLGTQGLKRKKSLVKKNFFVCSVDPKNKNADEKNIFSLKKYDFDTVFLCVPDFLKKKYIFLKKINDNKNIKKLKKIKPDLFIIGGYPQIFKKKFFKYLSL